MENNNKNLSFFQCDNYHITESGKVYRTATAEEIIKDKRNRFILIDNSGNKKRISLKKLYRKAFEKEFCFDTIENLKNEQWKPIADTDGKYFISNCGRVKSYCGYNAIVLKCYLQKSGYLEVKINEKNYKIHSLVANAFCENRYKGTEIKTEVHHINKKRTDNRADNLLILSIKEHHETHNRKETKDNE